MMNVSSDYLHHCIIFNSSSAFIQRRAAVLPLLFNGFIAVSIADIIACGAGRTKYNRRSGTNSSSDCLHHCIVFNDSSAIIQRQATVLPLVLDGFIAVSIIDIAACGVFDSVLKGNW